MLRKITGTVELEIRRYAPLHNKNFFFGFGEHALQTLNEIKLLIMWLLILLNKEGRHFQSNK